MFGLENLEEEDEVENDLQLSIYILIGSNVRMFVAFGQCENGDRDSNLFARRHQINY